MDNILQPLRQYVVHIRSKDAEKEGLLNSHLFINLQEPITINSKTEQIHQIILSGEIPSSFYNVSADVKNDTIIYNTNSTFTLPNKNYDIHELIRVITADTNFPFSAVYDRFTMKITLTNTSGSTQVINWSNSNCNKVLGWDSTSVDESILSGATTTSPNVVDLATIHSLFVKSNVSSNMVFSTRKGFSQTIQKVSVDVNSGQIIYLNQNDSRQHTVLNSNVDAMDIRITDQNDNLVNFNDINYELTIGFFIYPIHNSNARRNIDIKTIQTPRNELRPFTPTIQIRENNEIDNIDNENVETDIEHQEKRKIIDAVLEKMGKK